MEGEHEMMGHIGWPFRRSSLWCWCHKTQKVMDLHLLRGNKDWLFDFNSYIRTHTQSSPLTHTHRYIQTHLQDCCSLALLEVLWDWHQTVMPSSNSFRVRRFCQRGERTFTWEKWLHYISFIVWLLSVHANSFSQFIVGKSFTFTMLEPCNICFTSSSSWTPGKETENDGRIKTDTSWKLYLTVCRMAVCDQISGALKESWEMRREKKRDKSRA